MEKPKFAYYVGDDNGIIHIFRYKDVNFEKKPSSYARYITNEKELSEYLKKYPNNYSLAIDDDSEKEAKRLNEKYGLKIM